MRTAELIPCVSLAMANLGSIGFDKCLYALLNRENIIDG